MILIAANGDRPVSVPLKERRITRIAEPGGTTAGPASSTGHWPSFRGPQASGVADGQRLPDRWDGTTGQNILWRTPIPGLAHSSPIVWGDTIFVTTAISSRKDATFKPGLYGDGDASDDRSVHKWVIYALDKRTGRIRWDGWRVKVLPATNAISSPRTPVRRR